ncbi:hypothetical protein D9619_008461 [Psilocybe cf. subviscida]|uniref:Uncharacterized protein n=1 Tax=Psilocybe cf. subviscida TaxID=2480587 RepID=A0A8H5BAP9_9AGAR|nr:hypothetical protein D9619_008461 [Psilocybe cf. subviscida]
MHSLPIKGEKISLLVVSIWDNGSVFDFWHPMDTPSPNVEERLQNMASHPYSFTQSFGCRYILWLERDRDTRTKLAEAAGSAEGKGEQFVGEEKLHGNALPTQTAYRHSYPPPRQAETPLPRPSSEAFSMRASESRTGGHNIDMVASNYPYLHGAESYILNRNRSLATTFTNSSISTNHSPRRSSDCGSRRTASTTLSHAQGSVLRAEHADSADGVDQNDEVEETQSESNIEIGSLQSSSSVNSEELRRFYNGRSP